MSWKLLCIRHLNKLDPSARSKDNKKDSWAMLIIDEIVAKVLDALFQVITEGKL